MDPTTIGLLVTTFVLLALLVAVVLRGAGRGEQLLQQQFIEVRQRLDEVVASQGRIPEAIATGRAEQATVLSQEFSNLARLVATQLEATQTTMGDRLEHTGGAISEVRERLGELSAATRRLEALGQNVEDVQKLLRVPNLRGTLGEVWLEELIAQIFPVGLFEMQHTFPTGDRADAVLHIGGRLLVVDSKFPLEACRRMMEAGDGPGAAVLQAGFRRSVKLKIDEIADRYILPDHGTFDFAMMYIPAERVYYEAMVRDGTAGLEESLIAYAMARKVVPVSPNTFYAYLSAVLHGLRGLQVEERAKEMLGLLRGIQLELGRLRRTQALVGRHLDNAARQQHEAERQMVDLIDRFERITGPQAAGEPALTGPETEVVDATGG